MHKSIFTLMFLYEWILFCNHSLCRCFCDEIFRFFNIYLYQLVSTLDIIFGVQY